jgi:hypothetical protein
MVDQEPGCGARSTRTMTGHDGLHLSLLQRTRFRSRCAEIEPLLYPLSYGAAGGQCRTLRQLPTSDDLPSGAIRRTYPIAPVSMAKTVPLDVTVSAYGSPNTGPTMPIRVPDAER